MSYLDWLLLRHPTEWRAVQNIGGIGNVTFLPPLSEADTGMIAFDTGPGNALLDTLLTIMTDGQQTYDAGGAWAAQGHIDAAWLDALLLHPYYLEPPPKSTGRELFGSDYAALLLSDGRARGIAETKIDDPVRALALISVAAKNAPQEDEVWIHDIYQNIYCGAGQGVRKQATGIVADWRTRYGRKPDTRDDSGLGQLTVQATRTCGNGEPVLYDINAIATEGTATQAVAPAVRPAPLPEAGGTLIKGAASDIGLRDVGASASSAPSSR